MLAPQFLPGDKSDQEEEEWCDFNENDTHRVPVGGTVWIGLGSAT